MKLPQSTISYEMYRDNNRQVGTVEITLPNVQAVTQTMQGAGISGTTDVPVLGLTQDLSMTINFRVAYPEVAELLPHKYHHLEFWAAIQNLDTDTGQYVTAQHKIVVRAMVKGDNLGALKPGEVQGRSLELSLSYFKEIVDGKLIREIDKFNNVHKVGGQDLLASVRAAVGL